MGGPRFERGKRVAKYLKTEGAHGDKKWKKDKKGGPKKKVPCTVGDGNREGREDEGGGAGGGDLPASIRCQHRRCHPRAEEAGFLPLQGAL